MTKRPAVDLAALTSAAASPMPEAAQRVAGSHPPPAGPGKASGKNAKRKMLAFKVPPALRKRFRRRAADADLKPHELLFEALAAWEEKHGLASKGGRPSR
jgi:hypothetical protein